MARIFFALAILALTLLITNIVLGWNTGDFGGATRELLEAGRAWDQAERSLIKSEATYLIAPIFLSITRWISRSRFQ